MSKIEPLAISSQTVSQFYEERRRQVVELGYTPEHDDQHSVMQILDMVQDHVVLALSGHADDPHTEMVQAGALFIAATERLDRQIKEQ